jgi:hypothetical protein
VTPDLINAMFELCGGFFILLHCKAVLQDKTVAGVSVLAVIFFTLWGYWNLYYYPSLGQYLSFYAGVFIMIANTMWLGLLFKFRPKIGEVK